MDMWRQVLYIVDGTIWIHLCGRESYMEPIIFYGTYKKPISPMWHRVLKALHRPGSESERETDSEREFIEARVSRIFLMS